MCVCMNTHTYTPLYSTWRPSHKTAARHNAEINRNEESQALLDITAPESVAQKTVRKRAEKLEESEYQDISCESHM